MFTAVSYTHLDVYKRQNHDRIQAKFYEENCIEIIEDLMEIEPFTFVHEPNNHSEKFSISGHIHPGIILCGKAKQAIKLPCFAISENQIILPAFSKFTGLYTKSFHQNFKFIAFTTGTIFEAVSYTHLDVYKRQI